MSTFVIEAFLETGPRFGVEVSTVEDLPRLKAALEEHSLFESARKCEAWYNYLLDRIEGEYNIATNAEAE